MVVPDESDDFTNAEWNALMRWLKQYRRMTTARATAYLQAISDFADAAKERHRG